MNLLAIDPDFEFHHTHTHKATWLNRPARQVTFSLTGKPFGPRIIVHQWLDTHEVFVRAIDGDGRTPAKSRIHDFLLGIRPDRDKVRDAMNRAEDRLFPAT